MINYRNLLYVVVSVCGVGFSTEAAAYCLKPDPPYCIDSFGTFDDDWSFDLCKLEVEGYLSDTDEYISCVVRKARMDSDEAQTEANDVIERFNCKAKGNKYCP